jgi:hypothetical protein
MGNIKDRQTGTGIVNAMVHIRSESRAVEKSCQTDDYGNYRISGLPQTDEQNQVIADYVLTVIASNYPVYTLGNIQMGQERNIALSQLADSLIQGIIHCQTSTQWIIDIFENQGDFVQSQTAQSNEWFTCNGLNASVNYQLRISSVSTQIQYWIGENIELIENKNNAMPFPVEFTNKHSSPPGRKTQKTDTIGLCIYASHQEYNTCTLFS